jgi:hypothetical protein
LILSTAGWAGPVVRGGAGKSVSAMSPSLLGGLQQAIHSEKGVSLVFGQPAFAAFAHFKPESAFHQEVLGDMATVEARIKELVSPLAERRDWVPDVEAEASDLAAFAAYLPVREKVRGVLEMARSIHATRSLKVARNLAALLLDEKPAVENAIVLPGSGSVNLGLVELVSDPELRAKTLAAADDMLAIGHGDALSGERLTDWSLSAVNLYRALGLGEAEITARVGVRLDQFLAAGRVRGLSLSREQMTLPGSSVFKALPAPVGAQPVSPLTAFEAKYRLETYRTLKARIGMESGFSLDTVSYKTSLSDAFRLAEQARDEARAGEIFWHMLKLGGYESAIKAAYDAARDDILLHVGFLALAEFLGSKTRGNGLLYAIEAFKRVQGSLKSEAAETLFDLSQMLVSDGFSAESFADYAFRALRSTGRFLRAHPLDFVTVVEDPKYKAALKAMTRRFKAPPNEYLSAEYLLALAAIGDKEAILAYAREEVSRGTFGLSGAMRYALVSVGTPAELREFAEALLSPRGLAASIRPGATFMRAASLYHAARDSDGLARVRSLLVEKGRKLSDQQEKEMQAYESEVAGTAKETVRVSAPQDERSKSLTQVTYKLDQMRERLKEIRETSTEESRAEALKAGRDYLALGRYFEASEEFMTALDRAGLITAGDGMVKRGDGLNASGAYLFAALL